MDVQNLQKQKPSAAKPWLKYYSAEAIACPLPECSIYSRLKSLNAGHEDEKAIHYYGTTITYGKLLENIDRCAEAFSSLGVGRGEIVSFISVTIPETVYAMYGLNKLGAVSNFIDPRMDKDSICRMIADAGSRIVVILDIAYPKLRAIENKLNLGHIIVQSAADSMAPLTKLGYRLTTKLPDIPYGESVEKWNTFVSRAKNTHGTACAEAVPYIPDETAVITYTGGTTGFPKGVMLTNDGMNTVALNFAYAGLHYDRGDRFLDIMPVFSSYGVVCGLHMPLTLGLENVVIPRFEASKLGALIRKYKCNHMLAVPAFYEMVMSDPKMKHYDLSFMRMLGTGGDTMNPALEEKLYNFMREHGIPNPPAQGYGMSEVHAAASFNFESTYRPGSVGIPSLKTTISIFRPETTEELDIGEEGEVCISGPTIMKGYYKGEAETDYVMKRHPDGQLWVHSGDIGYMDEDGFVYVKGRVKHMIIRFDGHKVFPIQMETFLSAHPAVRNAAVIGVPDRAHGQGQLPLAVVELDDGHKDKEKADALCRELFDSCNETLEERGRPVAVVAVDKMPITGLGKNDIRSLTEQYREYKY